MRASVCRKNCIFTYLDKNNSYTVISTYGPSLCVIPTVSEVCVC